MRLVYLSLAGVLFMSQQAFALCDSIGVKKINGKTFIQHKVTKGEGLLSIGREYGVTTNEIKQANSNLKSSVNLGQIILVPYKRPSKNTSKDKKATGKNETKKHDSGTKQSTNKNTEKSPVYHTVSGRETLYSIAVKHGVQVADISKWNKLKGNAIASGQKLIVGYKSAEKIAADGSKNKWQKPTAEKKEDNPSAKAVQHKEEEVKTRGNEANDKKAENTATDTKPVKEDKADAVQMVWKEVRESGVASWIDDGSLDKEKKFALHKTAPIGTVIKLVNPMNGHTAVVKVIGRLPQDGTEENVVIKITKSSADKLGLRDKYFRLDMSYGMEVEKKK